MTETLPCRGGDATAPTDWQAILPGDTPVCLVGMMGAGKTTIGRLLARPTATLSLEAQQRRELKQKMFGD